MSKWIFILAVSLSPYLLFSQDRSIYIQHLGPEDGALPTIWIPRDTANIDFSSVHNKILFSSVDFSTHSDFDFLECILKNELKAVNKDQGAIEGNIRIVFFDEAFKIIDERYICCGIETVKTFSKLLKIKSVAKNPFAVRILSGYTSFMGN